MNLKVISHPTMKRMPYLILLAFMLQWLPAAAGRQTDTPLQITLTPEYMYDFREVYVGMQSDVQFYRINASGAHHPLKIEVEKPFAISLDCHSGYSQALHIETDNGLISGKRIFVRFFPAKTGPDSAIIRHIYPDADTLSMTLKGSGTHQAIPEEYYAEAVSTGSMLKTELHHIIKDHQIQTYASIWSHFESTDATFDGMVWDIYSDIPCDDPPYRYTFIVDQDQGAGGNAESQVFNREHSMPLSWFGGQVSPMFTDMFHIYPVDKWVNALRANYPYGEVSNPGTTTLNGGKLGNNDRTGYNGLAFEPVDEYKGDLARTFFYMITRYEDQVETWTYSPEGNHMLDHAKWPGYRPWVIDMLLEWHAQDTVSQKEIQRNNAIYQIQGNRNPFIDHPEFVYKIWGQPETKVYESDDIPGISIYPNPAKTHFMVSTAAELQFLGILSLTGNVIMEVIPSASAARINTEHLKSGIYLVRVTTNYGIHHEKIIIY